MQNQSDLQEIKLIPKNKNQSLSQPKTTSKPETKVSIPLSNTSLQSAKEIYEEVQTINDQPVDLCDSQDIPLSQKNRFHHRLKQLTQQQLAQIIFIIQQNSPEKFKELGGGRCQLILDNVDLQTFKKVKVKMDDLVQGQKATGSKKVKI